MLPTTVAVLVSAFILGLLSTAVPWGALGIVLLGGVAALLRSPRFSHRTFKWWRKTPSSQIWVLAGFVGLVAALYLQIRTPQPNANDISKIIPQLHSDSPSAVVKVEGTVENLPRRTRSQRAQFLLRAERVSVTSNSTLNLEQRVGGKLYVTVPTSQVKKVHPGQTATVEGRLYQPRSADNPQAFDFRQYLAAKGVFAGLKGNRLTITNRGSAWGWWALQQRIIKTQVQGLGMRQGLLVSAMILGNNAVSLPFEIRDEFVRVGLAHALAASGFQISLILAVILALARNCSNQQKFVIGSIALLGFGSLSGFEPAVVRAVLMGIAGLLALVLGRQSRPISTLLLVAFIMLLVNPLWIWHLGFQLSFLATLGLIVTVPAVSQRLDWLPPAIAMLVAVPLAASLWTLPLQLYSFGVFPVYGLVANVLSTPLISVLTIGGFISSVVGVIWPLAGSALAWLLYYPCQLLLIGVHFFSQLPGHIWAIGKISVWQLALSYSLFCLVWLKPEWRSRWQMVGVASLALVLIPVWQAKTNTAQVTVLATGNLPVMVIQQPEATVLINSGDRLTASQTVIPFLQQQGINRLDWTIVTETSSRRSGWQEIAKQVSIKTLSHTSTNLRTTSSNEEADRKLQQVTQPLQQEEVISVGSTRAKLLREQPLALQLEINQLTWLLMSDPQNYGQEIWLRTANLPAIDVLWWAGRNFDPAILNLLNPKVVILSAQDREDSNLLELRSELQARNMQIYLTGQDGAIQWTPKTGFDATVAPTSSVDSKFD